MVGLSEESIFTTASKLNYHTRQQEKQFDPRSHLNPKTRRVCPHGFPETAKEWIKKNLGKYVPCPNCEFFNNCVNEMTAYSKLASKET